MILHCDLEVQDSKTIFLEDDLEHNDASPLLSLVVKGSAIQKESSAQTFINILTFYCDLDLEHKNPISQYDILAYNNVLSNLV